MSLRRNLMVKLAVGAVAIGISTGIGVMVLVDNASAKSDIQRVPVTWHAQGSAATGKTGEIAGAEAKLVRTDNGISWNIQTSDLVPGNAYTVWLVVINNADACSSTPCSPNPDILVNFEATGAQVVYGGGHVAGGSGKGTFAGSRQAGPIPEGWFPGGSLDMPTTAEIHFVLNDHGPVIPELMPGMIMTYREGCTDESLPGIFPASAKADGTPGENTCILWQVAVFE